MTEKTENRLENFKKMQEINENLEKLGGKITKKIARKKSKNGRKNWNNSRKFNE